MDGRIATASGDSRWITSPAQRALARRMRHAHDGVVVGIGTVLRDDPLLLPSKQPRRPFYRVVFDSSLRLPLDSRLVRSARRSPVVVIGLRGHKSRRLRLEAHSVRVLEASGRGGRVALGPAIKLLWTNGLRSLMVEGGSELLGSFLAARMVDEIALFRAPLLLGGRGSRPAFGGPDPRHLAQALRLRGPRIPPVELWYPRR
jgi:diaminohydroxyphosphoribosylaminopyrimidine deaminase/5-amino-6-(5-phosphoribosylamino)uracil reductase